MAGGTFGDPGCDDIGPVAAATGAGICGGAIAGRGIPGIGAGGVNAGDAGAKVGAETCGPGALGITGGGAVWYGVGETGGFKGGNPSVDSVRTRGRSGLASSEIGISCTCLFIRFPPRTFIRLF